MRSTKWAAGVLESRPMVLPASASVERSADCAAANKAGSQRRDGTQSASVNAIHSPLARLMPALRATVRPRTSASNTIVAPARLAASAVRSRVPASTTTMHSKSLRGRGCVTTARTASAMQDSALSAGMTTEIFSVMRRFFFVVQRTRPKNIASTGDDNAQIPRAARSSIRLSGQRQSPAP